MLFFLSSQKNRDHDETKPPRLERVADHERIDFYYCDFSATSKGYTVLPLLAS